MKAKKQAGRILSNEKGFVLPLAFIFITIIAILGATAVIATTTDLRIATNYKTSVQASFIAEAGVEYGLNWLRNQPAPPPGTEPIDPLVGVGGIATLGVGYYTISIDPDDNNPNVHLNRYRITSTGSVDYSVRNIVMEVEVESFARYAYFTNTEYFQGNPVWFITGDNLTGPTHTNSHFHISGNPVFDGLASSHDNFIDYMHGGPPYDNPDFRGGLQLGIARTEMPTDTARVRARAGLLLTGDTTVTLLANGTMNVTNAGVTQNLPLPANGVLHVDDGTLSISGTLKGRLTAGSEENIIITGNITYNTDPRDPYLDPPSQDMLGLVAEENVVVCQYAGHYVEINASIMAIDGSFTVEHWWEGLRGTLTVYGGIIQASRGPVGTFSSRTGQRRSGFAKDYHYDLRLRTSPPPFFPTTGDYVVLSWREQK